MPNMAEKRSSRHQALVCQPVSLEEPLLLDERSDASLGQFGGQLHVVQAASSARKVVDAAGVAQHDLFQVEAHQRVRAATDLERVVAADRGVALAVVARPSSGG